MNTTEIKITVPEGYEIDRENSTFECIKFKKKGLTYNNVTEKLFTKRITWYIDSSAKIEKTFMPEGYEMTYGIYATSQKQLQRLLAINKLMNVAEYLNEGWKPDWENSNCSKWYIIWNHRLCKFIIDSGQLRQRNDIYFKTPDLALQAIEILGEKEVKLALGV